MKRKGLLSSIVTIALCLSLIAGSTFALFTSTSQVDIAVTSGAVELNASIDVSGLKTYSLEQPQAANKFAAGGTAILQNGALLLNKIVPGDRAEFPISVINRSNVDVQYRVLVNVSGELANGLIITAKLGENTYDLTNPLADTYADKTQWFEWKADQGASREQIDMVIELPKEAGNEFQRKSAYITVIVEAVQANAEIWDGKSVDTSWYADNGAYGTIYYINNAAQLAGIGVLTARGHNFADKTIVLEQDINLNELPWTPIDGFGGTFDGNGHTISGLYIDDIAKDGAGLFGKSAYAIPGSGVKNLTVDGAFVRGHKWVGVLWGHGNATQITNCAVKNATIIATEKRIGAIIGYVADESVAYEASIDNNVVENCAIYYAVEADKAYDVAIGTANGVTDVEVTASTNTITDCTMQQADRVIVGLKDFFAFAKEVNDGNKYSGKTVKLHTDINLRNILWTPIGQPGSVFNGTFDGQNHLISNLYVKGGEDVALFGNVQGTVKNLRIENVRAEGTKKVAAVVADIYGYVENCHVTNAIVDAKPVLSAGVYDDANNVGVIVGYLAERGNTSKPRYSVKNCTVTNAVVAAYRDLGTIVGKAQYGTEISGNTVKNVSLAYIVAYPYEGGKENGTMGEIVGWRSTNTSQWAVPVLEENNTFTNVKKDIYLTRPVEELIAGNAYTPISVAGVYDIEENMFFYDKPLMVNNKDTTGDFTINGNGNVLTFNDVAGIYDVDWTEVQDEGKGFVLYSKGAKNNHTLITVKDLTLLSNLSAIYLGRYTEGIQSNVPGDHSSRFYFENVKIMNLETDYMSSVLTTSAVALFGEGTFKNCSFVGSHDLEGKDGYKAYDLVLHNYSRATLEGGEYGNINATLQIWNQLTVKDAVVGSIDTRSSTSNSFKEGGLLITGNSQVGTIHVERSKKGSDTLVTVDAGAVVDILNVPMDINPANIVINGTVNHLMVGGVETTYAAWVAAYNAAMNP